MTDCPNHTVALRPRAGRMLSSVLAATLFLSVISPLFAHGDLHVQIDALTPQIQSAATAELHLKRGELHRLDENYAAALADFDLAEKLEPTFDNIRFCRGRALFESGQPKAAVETLSAFLAKRPEHIEGHMVRARAYARLKEYQAAVADYDRIIALIENPTPDCFLERAEALVALGLSETAIKSLDQGINRLGNLLSLQKAALDIEITIKKHKDALARVDRVMATLQRKEVWQTRRGEILEAEGRRDDAARAYAEALSALDQLPPHHRKSKPMRDLATLLTQRVGNESTQNPPSTN